MKGELMGFTLGNIHSSELGLVRSNKGLSSKELFGKFSDTTVALTKSDITLFDKSVFQSHSFQMTTAFTEMSESTIKQLKDIWNKNQLYRLIFDESPHKYYMVKVDKLTSIKHLAFEKNNVRYYNGDLTFSFVSYFPYALSRFSDLSDNEIIELPNELRGYWENLNDLPEQRPAIDVNGNFGVLEIYNFGDLPALFTLNIKTTLPAQNTTITSPDGTLVNTVRPERRIKFDLLTSARTNGEEIDMNFKNVLVDKTMTDKIIQVDCFRGTIFGLNESGVRSNILYNNIMEGSFIILPPKQSTCIEFKLENAKAISQDGAIDESIEILLSDLQLNYELQYIYRD